MNVANEISEAVRHSREHNVIITVSAPWDEAIAALNAELRENEEGESVENGDTLEFWAYDPADVREDEMTFRVHVLRA